ncbi:MAG: DUF3592 domain-containing protein [Chloroflexota bacterium]|nr:DUF3592 domain-containing protein [Ardenticatenaceae bacterium]
MVLEKLLVLLLFSLFLAAIFHTIYWGNRSKAWPSTKGRITNSKIVTHMGNAHGPRVGYQYIVNGSMYESNRIAFGFVGGFIRTLSGGYIKQYPKGKPVRVFYNPNKPEMATLEVGVTLETYIWLFIFGPLLLIGLIA